MRVAMLILAYALAGAGAESMTTHYGPGAGPDEVSETIMSNQESADCLIPVSESGHRSVASGLTPTDSFIL